MTPQEEKKEAYGIKETLEIVDAAEGLTFDTIEALKDGAQFEDLQVFVKNMGPIRTAVEGADQVDDELKDLSVDEIKELSARGISFVFALLKKIREMRAPQSVNQAIPQV